MQVDSQPKERVSISAIAGLAATQAKEPVTSIVNGRSGEQEAAGLSQVEAANPMKSLRLSRNAL